MNKNNKSGVKGVYYDAKGKKYRAQIGFYGKKIRLGSFQTIDEAVQARQKAEQEYRIQNYKRGKINLCIAHFTMQKILGFNPEDELYLFYYDHFATNALLFAFANQDDINGRNFVYKACDQIANDVTNKIYHPLFNPFKAAYQYEISEISLLRDYLSGYTVPQIAKMYSYSYSTAFRRLQAFQEEIKSKIN